MPRMVWIATALTLAGPMPALACFDAAQCARDAQMQARMVAREVSQLSSELRSLRADRNALATDMAALRETLSNQDRRIKALEQENAELRDHLGLPPKDTPPAD